MRTQKAFGEFARKRRLDMGLTLRGFARKNKLDWAYLSRVERGLAPPPRSRAALGRYARALDIREDGEDGQTFFDLAAICAGSIPESILSNRKLLAKLPLVFRTLQGRRLSAEKRRELAEMIR
jgi:transcriptional regulator with XRE-family HTH domain